MGEDAGRQFLVFEFVPGDPLNALIEGRALNVRRAVELAIQLADALADAEALDLTHGDIRPATIVVTSKDRAKLMNFGLAAFTSGGASRRTLSPMYVAPEQAAGGRGDIRSDIFSLGAVLFEMLTGPAARPGTGAQQREQGRAAGAGPHRRADARVQSGQPVSKRGDGRRRSCAASPPFWRSARTAEEAAFEAPRRQRSRSGTVVVLGVLIVVVAIALWLWRSLAGR